MQWQNSLQYNIKPPQICQSVFYIIHLWFYFNKSSQDVRWKSPYSFYCHHWVLKLIGIKTIFQSSAEDESSSSDDESDISGMDDVMPDIMLDDDAKYNGNKVLMASKEYNFKQVPISSNGNDIKVITHMFLLTCRKLFNVLSMGGLNLFNIRVITSLHSCYMLTFLPLQL